ncbi:MAG: site-specific integrase [Treponema sp.]|uniref:tyrosine-type recombinase/integrase n=1 Tax=Treponema sp. TaxID=166 RepID=UPI00298EB148|nr:site-specific integrase [Treponema sp.]MCQ2600911.1 site-specific integrase [Treponema sp.]
MEVYEVQTKKNNIVISKFYYSYKDCNNRTHQKVCKNCKTKEEAEKYAAYHYLNNEEQYLIKNIAKNMFLPDSEHLNRLESFGKKICEETRAQKRQILEIIIQVFGNEYLNRLPVLKIEKYLLEEHKNHSGSWKNLFLETFGSLYDETIWCCNIPVNKPDFQKFARNSKKADVLSTEELNKLFDIGKWDDYREYLLFYISATCGLRLGEARGLQVDQFFFKEQFLLVNGFCKKNGFKTDYNKKATAEDKKYRPVPLPNETLYKVANYITENHLSGNMFLFRDNQGFIYTTKHLENVFEKMLCKCDIQKGNRKIVPHSLRFTYVTRMRRNLTAEEVRKIVGHNSVVMTEYYTRQSLPELKNTIKNALPVANYLFT